jgi:hypothetical protein
MYIQMAGDERMTGSLGGVSKFNPIIGVVMLIEALAL